MRPVRAASMGFTLIEAMIAIGILAVLMSLALPSFQQWMRNLEIRNAAESITNGLQKARAEAVTRNTNVSFTLGAETDWVVSVVAPDTPIESRPITEGSENATRTVLPAGASMITFNNLGIAVANADATPTLSQVDLAATGGVKNLRVTIGLGGNAKMCDPSLPAGSNPRAC